MVTLIKIMSLSRPTFESIPSATPTEVGVQRTSANLHEAIMDSVSSVRDSLPEQYRAHFETLRQEIIDFTKAHGISRESLGKPDLLRKATGKLSTQDLERLALLLERFEYLLKNGEPKKEDYTEALEYAEEFYHLEKQYASQVAILEQAGILKEGVILGIDGNEYPIPTLEQIAVRLFERCKELETKHGQGFTKLLLVPFGMSLDSLQETLKQFLLKYKESHSSFDLETNNPSFFPSELKGSDVGNFPDLVYYSRFFDRKKFQKQTKAQIINTYGCWIVHLLQPSDPSNSHSSGFAPIPREGQGTPQGDLVPRPPLEANKTPNEYLSILQKAQEDEDSPYHGETGMTPEDWIIAFMIHLTETGKPLDNFGNGTESMSYFTEAFFRSSADVLGAFWSRVSHWVILRASDPSGREVYEGTRSSVIV